MLFPGMRASLLFYGGESPEGCFYARGCSVLRLRWRKPRISHKCSEIRRYYIKTHGPVIQTDARRFAGRDAVPPATGYFGRPFPRGGHAPFQGPQPQLAQSDSNWREISLPRRRCGIYLHPNFLNFRLLRYLGIPGCLLAR